MRYITIVLRVHCCVFASLGIKSTQREEYILLVKKAKINLSEKGIHVGMMISRNAFTSEENKYILVKEA